MTPVRSYVFTRKGLMRLSWPLIAVTVVTLLATLANTVLLGQASQELNASVATANQLLGVLYDISVLFSLGALVVITQHLGAGRFEHAQRATVTALRASSFLGLAMASAIALAAPLLLSLINTPAQLAADARAYLWIVAGGLAFNAYIVAASAVLRAYGRTVQLLVLGVVVNIMDVSLLGVLLFVFELGVVGAALPTLLVRAAGVAILWAMVRRTSGVSVLTRSFTGLVGAGTMARLSIPTVVENGVYNLVIVVAVSWINLLGEDAINARSYALTLTALVTGVVLAVAQANETIVGWDVGAEQLTHATRQTMRAAGWSALAAGGLALLLWMVAQPALSIFGANDVVVTLARTALGVSVILLPLSAVTTTLYGALRSAGDVSIPMAYSVVSSVAVLLPLSWLLIQRTELGLAGAFWALVGAESTKAVLLTVRWLGRGWQLPLACAGNTTEQVVQTPGPVKQTTE